MSLCTYLWFIHFPGIQALWKFKVCLLCLLQWLPSNYDKTFTGNSTKFEELKYIYTHKHFWHWFGRSVCFLNQKNAYISLFRNIYQQIYSYRRWTILQEQTFTPPTNTHTTKNCPLYLHYLNTGNKRNVQETFRTIYIIIIITKITQPHFSLTICL